MSNAMSQLDDDLQSLNSMVIDLAFQHEMATEFLNETEEDKRYWRLRQVNDAYEYRRVQAFYEDDRHLSPIGAAMGL